MKTRVNPWLKKEPLVFVSCGADARTKPGVGEVGDEVRNLMEQGADESYFGVRELVPALS